MESLVKEGVNLFKTNFSTSTELCCSFAPGRVNLIGEHTDYNNGFVFPMALNDMGTLVVGKQCSEGIALVTSANVNPEKFTFKDNTSNIPQWAKYVVGVAKKFEEVAKIKVCVEASIVSNLPMGAGLSSSASLEVSFFTFLEEVYDIKVDKIDKIKACQAAEHQYAGVPCGIMDQFIATLGAKNQALFINCKTNEYEMVPFGGDGLELVVTDTHKKHELAGGEYANRRETCEAVSISMNIDSLAEATLEKLVRHFSVPGKSLHLPPKSYARARHVVTEIARAIEGKQALCRDDVVLFGKLMNNSHKSLCDDYEVTCKELDEVVRVGWDTKGVLGSRMTGKSYRATRFCCISTLYFLSYIFCRYIDL